MQKGTEAEEAAKRNDATTLFRVVRELTGAECKSSVPIKDKNRKILITAEEKKIERVEHFKEVLNQP